MDDGTKSSDHEKKIKKAKIAKEKAQELDLEGDSDDQPRKIKRQPNKKE